jgi:integrase
MSRVQAAAPPTSNRGRKLHPEPLTPKEVERLATVPNPRYPTGARNRALILVLAGSGLRITEALSLRPKDHDSVRGTLRVLQGKGGKARTVPVTGAAALALARWLEHRSRLGHVGTPPIFCTLKGEPIESAYVRAMLPRLARRAGIEKRVHAHGLRHSFAAESIRRGVKINALSKVLGHSSSGVTARYIDHLGDDDAIEAVRAAWDDGASEDKATVESERQDRS